MSNELADHILDIFLLCVYIFGVIPLIGHALGTSSKPHWVGYDYEPCMGRGLIAHAVVGVIILIIWALFTKLFN